MKLVWHYTTGQKLPEILNSGVLDPKKSYTLSHERPILWFSLNQFYEPTAQKNAVTGIGQVIKLGMQGTHENCGGLFRFGCPITKVIEWKKVCKKAKLFDYDVQSLAETGIKQGANPSDWFGTLKKVKISECKIQAFNGTEWVDFEKP